MSWHFSYFGGFIWSQRSFFSSTDCKKKLKKCFSVVPSDLYFNWLVSIKCFQEDMCGDSVLICCRLKASGQKRILPITYKAGLTINDLYDTSCMTHNRFSNFHCVYTNIQVVHTEFVKVVLTEYSAFKISSKIIPEQAAAAVIIALISEKNKSRKLRVLWTAVRIRI